MNMEARGLPAEPPFTLDQALDTRWPAGFTDWDVALGRE